MTRSRSARIAGVAYLVYIAVGIANELLMARATNADGTAALVARITHYIVDVRLAIVFKVLECLSAFVIGVALYGITRDEDHELALLGLVCRVAEGVMIASILVPNSVGLLSLAEGSASRATDVATVNALTAMLLMPVGPIGAVFFAVGTTIFSYLLLRGRMIPVSLAGLGVFSSALLAVGVSLQLAGFLSGPLTGCQWIPEITFTIAFALWLLIKGVR